MKISKKELIRETAIKVFANLGYYNATTDKVAQEAGIAVGTIYNYFRSKQEILEYIFLVELNKRVQIYEEISSTDLPMKEKLRTLLKKHFAEVAKNPEVGQILVRERQSSDSNEPTAISKFLEGIPEWLTEMLDDAIKNGEISPRNTRIIGSAVFGAVQGVVSYAVFEENSSLREAILANAADELTELFYSGLG